jgi:hypothetical protein
MAIREWLESELFEIRDVYLESDPYKINADKEQDGHEFELNIEFNYYQGDILFTVKFCDKINKTEYDFLLHLLNYLNIHEEITTFTLEPLTGKLCCKSVISLFGEINHFFGIAYRFGIYTYHAMYEIKKILNVLRDSIGVDEAVSRIIGDKRIFVGESLN